MSNIYKLKRQKTILRSNNEINCADNVCTRKHIMILIYLLSPQQMLFNFDQLENSYYRWSGLFLILLFYF